MDYTFETGLRLVLESVIDGLHTAFPAQVQSFDATTMRVDVQPSLKTRFKGLEPSQWPIISEVPVIFPSSGEFHIVFQPVTGSYGMCLVSERSLDDWLLNGGIVEPEDNRSHDLSDVVFIPGIFPIPNAASIVPPIAPDCIEIRNSNGTSYLRLNGTELELQGAADWAVAYTDLKSAFDQLKNDFNAFVTTKFNLHMHPTAAVGSPSVPSILGTSSTADMSGAKVSNVRLP